ncbi:MAG: MerR family transcriptional regulator [Candidatus Glassbacteria bacterium]
MSWKIGKVSTHLQITRKRIREYEKEGLIKPRRVRKSNYRLYDEFDVRRIEQIQQLIHERGFTLSGLKYLLALAPCWELFPCAEKTNCLAYNYPHRRCWELKQAENGGCNCMGDCDRCPIFLGRNFATRPLFDKTPR